MRPLVALCLALTTCLAGCASSRPVVPNPSIDTREGDRDRLAGLAAAAKDRRYVATYQLSSVDRPNRTVTAAFATDGSWVVAIPGGALSGLADIAIYHSGATLDQCLLGPTAGTAGSRPDLGPLTPACFVVTSLAPANDPRVEHVFTDWIDRFIDRASALAVAGTVQTGIAGSCFSVESNSTALAPPVDPGVYCYTDDGTLTYVRAGFGTLLLAGTVSAAPPSVALPAPVVAAPPVPITAPRAP
ncbi:MAG TPA: hypothetical protein VH561_05515 [Micromonosporaceae bacterium]